MSGHVVDAREPEPRHVEPPATNDPAAWCSWAAESPGCVAFGMRPTRMEGGLAVLEVAESVVPLNPNGAVHGGLLAALADQAGALAILPMLDSGAAVVTGTLHLEYLRPAVLPLTVEARVLRRTRSLVFVDIEITAGGRLATVAHGTWVPTRHTPLASRATA